MAWPKNSTHTVSEHLSNVSMCSDHACRMFKIIHRWPYESKNILLSSDSCNWSGAHFYVPVGNSILWECWKHHCPAPKSLVNDWLTRVHSCSGAVANAHVVCQATGTSQGEQRRPALARAVEKLPFWAPEPPITGQELLGSRIPPVFQESAEALVFTMFAVQRKQRCFFAAGWFPSYTWHFVLVSRVDC